MLVGGFCGCAAVSFADFGVSGFLFILWFLSGFCSFVCFAIWWYGCFVFDWFDIF